MEPEYDEKLVWVEPAPANPDDAARPRDQAADESPWERVFEYVALPDP